MGRLQVVCREWSRAVNKVRHAQPQVSGSYIGRGVAMPAVIPRQSKVPSSGVQQAATVYLSA